MHSALARSSSWLLRGVGVALFVWIATRAELRNVGAMLSSVEVGAVVWLPLLTLTQIALRAWRWNLLLGSRQPRMPFSRAFTIYATGVFLGSFTPGRLGDLAKTIYLRQERDMPWERAMAATVTDRLFDLLLLTTLGVWALYHLNFWPAQFGIWTLCIAGIGVVFALLCRSVLPLREYGRRLGRFGPVRFLTGLKVESIRALRRAGGRALALTVVAYASYFLQTVFLARAVELPLTVFDVTAAIVLVGIASFLPISIAGFGTREGILAMVMAERGVPNYFEAALTYSALFFAFCFLIPSAFGFLCWLRRPIALESVRNRSAAGSVNL
jgi:hypothetical protein